MKISELPLAQTVGEDDVTVIVQDGTTKKAVVSVLTENVLQTADTNAQGYADTAEANAVKAANAAALAAQHAAEETAQGYANTAEANAKNAAPNDLLLTNGLLQLENASGPIGEGARLPKEAFELWNDITLEEDVLNITKTKTDDGRPIRAKKLFLLFIGKTQGSGVFMLRNAAATLYNVYTNVTKPENTGLFWAKVEKIADGVYFSQYSEDIVDVSNIPDLSNIAYSGSTSKGNLASNITFQEGGSVLYNSINFGGLPATPTAKLLAGSRIRIWGVMDDD